MSEIIDIQPVMTALSGESVIFETVDCYNEQITSNATLFCDIKKEVNNPATGPLYIEGAEPGDISDGTGPNTSRRFEKSFERIFAVPACLFFCPKELIKNRESH